MTFRFRCSFNFKVIILVSLLHPPIGINGQMMSTGGPLCEKICDPMNALNGGNAECVDTCMTVCGSSGTCMPSPTNPPTPSCVCQGCPQLMGDICTAVCLPPPTMNGMESRVMAIMDSLQRGSANCNTNCDANCFDDGMCVDMSGGMKGIRSCMCSTCNT